MWGLRLPLGGRTSSAVSLARPHYFLCPEKYPKASTSGLSCSGPCMHALFEYNGLTRSHKYGLTWSHKLNPKPSHNGEQVKTFYKLTVFLDSSLSHQLNVLAVSFPKYTDQMEKNGDDSCPVDSGCEYSYLISGTIKKGLSVTVGSEVHCEEHCHVCEVESYNKNKHESIKHESIKLCQT